MSEYDQIEVFGVLISAKTFLAIGESLRPGWEAEDETSYGGEI